MSGQYLQIIKGDDYLFTTQVNVAGVTQNLAGANVYFEGKGDNYWTCPETLFTVSTFTGEVAISGNNSENIVVSLNANFTANLNVADVGSWRLRLVNANGNVYTVDRGRLCVVHGYPSVNS